MEVEVSAVSVVEADRRSLGFAIRNVNRRMSGDGRPIRELPRSVEQLTELIGRVSLRDLVRETTDLIERLCIETALGLTGDNRASAAEMLGLSRQSLYMKLHRYGLADRDDQESGGDEVDFYNILNPRFFVGTYWEPRLIASDGLLRTTI